MNKKIIYKKVLKKWGESSQLGMLIEECSELITAVHKYFRMRRMGIISISAMAGEVADVEIMCEQFREIFPHARVDEIKEKKIERLERLLEREP